MEGVTAILETLKREGFEERDLAKEENQTRRLSY
jgi:hypothetical protein